MNKNGIVTPAHLRDVLGAHHTFELIDVREIDEFAAVHVEGATCVPMTQLTRRASEWAPDRPLTLICQSGQRATQAAQELRSLGFSRVQVVEGGTRACVAQGVPVVRGRRTIPIQRQVLIGAGAVVLAGLTLAWVHPVFGLISWLAGCSMVVAGFTGFCPLAKMLAAAPWNKHPEESAGQPAKCAAQGGCS